MKYLCLIPDGVADEPCDELDGRTPLEAADIPVIRAWASEATVGRTRNVPAGFPPGSDVAIMSILGLDPALYFTGRAPLEAAAMGITLRNDQVAYRCNLVTVEDGKMRDFSAGHISSDDSHPLIGSLQAALGGSEIEFHPGVGYRHICVVPEAMGEAECTPPHDLSDKPLVLPTGASAREVNALMDASKAVLKDHPVNLARLDDGKLPATQIWLWGQGKQPTMPTFADRYGIAGAIITAVDLVRGLGMLCDLELVDVPGATGYHDTDYEAKARHAIAALDRHDFCLVHVEATDEAGHEGNLDRKMTALENFDRLVCGPISKQLAGTDYRVLVLPDHPTPVALKTHTTDPVPFLLYDSTAPASGGEFTESGTADAEPRVGYELMGDLLQVK